MGLTDVVIDPRFRGFPPVAHGGYVCGMLARSVEGAARVSLRRAVPTESPLHIQDGGQGTVRLHDGDEVLAEGAATTLELDVPEPVGPVEAGAAASGYPGHHRHLFGECFCCGPDRRPGDGLRIFPGAVRGGGVVAAPWIPSEADADGHGVVRSEIVWAAFDCPQLWALILSAPGGSDKRVVTGALAAELRAPVVAGERYVVVARPGGGEGRRLFADAALFSADGEALGVARQTAVLTDSGVPLGMDRWR